MDMLENFQMVFMTLSYQLSESRSDRMTFACGNTCICSRQKLQDGQSTAAR